MAKNKTTIEYVCKECSSTFSKWSGKCSACGAWSTLEERIIEDKANKRGLGGQDLESSSQTLKSIQSQENQRLSTGNSEFDRTLGGGLAPGSLILIGGDPGIGKSTLVLQTLATMSAANVKTLYVSGEESAVQVKIRSERLELSGSDMLLMCETNLEKVLAEAKRIQPEILVIDSIQTVYKTELPGTPGSVTQLRECTLELMVYAKNTGVSRFLWGT